MGKSIVSEAWDENTGTVDTLLKSIPKMPQYKKDTRIITENILIFFSIKNTPLIKSMKRDV